MKPMGTLHPVLRYYEVVMVVMEHLAGMAEMVSQEEMARMVREERKGIQASKVPQALLVHPMVGWSTPGGGERLVDSTHSRVVNTLQSVCLIELVSSAQQITIW